MSKISEIFNDVENAEKPTRRQAKKRQSEVSRLERISEKLTRPLMPHYELRIVRRLAKKERIAKLSEMRRAKEHDRLGCDEYPHDDEMYNCSGHRCNCVRCRRLQNSIETLGYKTSIEYLSIVVRVKRCLDCKTETAQRYINGYMSDNNLSVKEMYEHFTKPTTMTGKAYDDYVRSRFRKSY